MFKKYLSSEKARKLASNTLMLSILSFSGYFLALVTLPYQSRILGPELFGMVSFAMAFGIYFQLVIDFGFTLSATEQVAKHLHDKDRVSKIVSAVTWNKVFIALLSLCALLLLCVWVKPFNQDPLLYFFFAMSYIFIALIPDYLYRGMENMKAITVRTVAIRAVSIGLIFIFLRGPSDYYAVPVSMMLGNMAAFGYTLWDIHRKEIRLTRVSFREFSDTLKQSSLFFYSRIATNIYSASNTFVLGLVYSPASHAVGFFTSADKLTSAAKFSLTPLVDSLYPHMVKNKDFRLVKKILLVFVPIITVICTIVWIFAYDICAIIFGPDFRGAGEYLRWLLLTAVVAFPSMVLGYPTLSPMGLARFANLSVIGASVVHITQLLLLFATGRLTVVTVCIATIITESIALLLRVIAVLKNMHRVRDTS